MLVDIIVVCFALLRLGCIGIIKAEGDGGNLVDTQAEEETQHLETSTRNGFPSMVPNIFKVHELSTEPQPQNMNQCGVNASTADIADALC